MRRIGHLLTGQPLRTAVEGLLQVLPRGSGIAFLGVSASHVVVVERVIGITRYGSLIDLAAALEVACDAVGDACLISGNTTPFAAVIDLINQTQCTSINRGGSGKRMVIKESCSEAKFGEGIGRPRWIEDH